MMTYGPLLETYLGGCVRSDEGTSLTANLQILAENLVVMQGETGGVCGGDGWRVGAGADGVSAIAAGARTALSAKASGPMSEWGNRHVDIV